MREETRRCFVSYFRTIEIVLPVIAALRERIRGNGTMRGEGYVRILLAEGTREIEEMITLYQDRLEKRKTVPPEPEALRFIEVLSG
jgi:hypothetical protein